ncbi:MAG: glycosyltransferase family 4 protein [Candidatus Micrarchaeia archaeon]
MKIAAIGHCLLARRQYGIFNEMREHEIELFVPKAWPGVLERPVIAGKVHRMRLLNHGNTYNYIMPGIMPALAASKPDLVYTNAEPWSNMCFYAQLCSKMLKIPHVFFTWENTSWPTRGFQKRKECFVVSCAAGAVAGNKDAENRLKILRPDLPVKRMPNGGIDTKLFRHSKKSLRHELGLEDKKVVLFVGRFVKEKGIWFIIDSIERVRQEIKDAHFVFAGKGPEKRAMMLRILNSPFRDACTLLSWRPYEELPLVYNSADIFVYPSYSTPHWREQFGFAILEAMACGLPVITTRCGAIEEVAGDAAEYVPERDSNALAKKIVELLCEEGKRKSLAAKGRERAQVYDLKRVARMHKEFFEEIAGRGHI